MSFWTMLILKSVARSVILLALIKAFSSGCAAVVVVVVVAVAAAAGGVCSVYGKKLSERKSRVTTSKDAVLSSPRPSAMITVFPPRRLTLRRNCSDDCAWA